MTNENQTPEQTTKLTQKQTWALVGIPPIFLAITLLLGTMSGSYLMFLLSGGLISFFAYGIIKEHKIFKSLKWFSFFIYYVLMGLLNFYVYYVNF